MSARREQLTSEHRRHEDEQPEERIVPDFLQQKVHGGRYPVQPSYIPKIPTSPSRTVSRRNGGGLRQLGAARLRRGKTTSAHAMAIRITDDSTIRSKGSTTPLRMALALR